jgi:hypothetical protein
MNTRVATAVTAGVAVLALAGCGPRSPQAQTEGSSSSGTTSSTSTSPSPTPTGTSTADATSSSPSPSASSSATTHPTTSSKAAAQPPGTAAATRCLAGHLKISLARAEGAAGSTYDTVRLTNTGTATCTLYGYPGVSLVGHGNGTQIGAAADRDHSVAPTTVLVRSGGSTTFVVRLVRAGNYPRSTCAPTPADGFRVYPPGSTAALYLPLAAATGCAKTSVHLLTVRPVGRTA